MNEAHDPHRTVDVPSTLADALDAGLAAAFAAPHPGLGAMPAGLLKGAEGIVEEANAVKAKRLAQAEGDANHLVRLEVATGQGMASSEERVACHHG